MITFKRLQTPCSFIGIIFFVIFILGCEEQSMQARGPTWRQADFSEGCFGLSNSFSGQPNMFQRRNLPQAMRGAYCIEPVRSISMAELREMLNKKQLVAEEFNEGNRYVAMRDSRIVKFDTFVAGLVIVIERYRIVDY